MTLIGSWGCGTGSGALISSFTLGGTTGTGSGFLVVVSLAVLDAANYKMVSQAGKMSAILEVLAVPPASGQSYADCWTAKEDTFNALLPLPGRGSLRVFKKVVPIPMDPILLPAS